MNRDKLSPIPIAIVNQQVNGLISVSSSYGRLGWGRHWRWNRMWDYSFGKGRGLRWINDGGDRHCWGLRTRWNPLPKWWQYSLDGWCYTGNAARFFH